MRRVLPAAILLAGVFLASALGQNAQQAVNAIVASSCTNQFVRSIAASGAATCATVLAASDISGLAASATTDATNASNISSGTLAAARGGAGTINGALKSNGSGTVSQAATTDLSDVTGATAWTPADGSGASLVFTGVSANYTKIGNMVFAYATLSYPSTANGNGATISGLPLTSGNAQYARQCTLNWTSTANATHMLGSANGTTVGIYGTAATQSTNVQMSTAQIFFICVYPVS